MTHINAYYMAVDEAKAEVELAKGKLAQAEEALEAKKASEPVEVKLDEKPRKVSRDAEDGKFVSKEEAKDNPKTTVTETIHKR